MRTGDVVASGILLASTAALGVLAGGLVRDGWRVAEYRAEDLAEGPLRTCVTAAITYGLVGLSIHAFGRWVEYYAHTRQMLSLDEVLETYE